MERREEPPKESLLFKNSKSRTRVYLVNPTKQLVLDTVERMQGAINGYAYRERPGFVPFLDASGALMASLRGCYDRRRRKDGWWSRTDNIFLHSSARRFSVAWWRDVAGRQHVTFRRDMVSRNAGDLPAFACDCDPQTLPTMACLPLRTALLAISKDGFNLQGRFYDHAAALIACDAVEFDPRFEEHVRVVRAALQPQ